MTRSSSSDTARPQVAAKYPGVCGRLGAQDSIDGADEGNEIVDRSVARLN